MNIGNNNFNNNVNFKAKLEIKDNAKILKPYEQKLSNIAKKFEEKTAKYNHERDFMTIGTDSNKDEWLHANVKGLSDEEFASANLVNGSLKELLSKSETYIVNKLVKFFHVATDKAVITKKATALQDDVDKMLKPDTCNANGLFKYWQNAQKAVQTRLTNNDSFFSKSIDSWNF